MQKVLILDGNQRSALAATRSLGSQGISVVVAEENNNSLSSSSKYCKECFTYPSPYEDAQDFIKIITKESIKRGIKVLYPMTDVTTYNILKNRDKFKDINIPFASFESFDSLTNKWKLFELAKKLNIPAPLTYFIKTPEELADILPKLNFPVVLKPYRSKILSNEKWIEASVKYANSVAEIIKRIDQYEYFKNHPFLIQEYIQGEGQGIFTLYNEGTPVVFFAHRRIREKPPSGGASVLSESCEVNPLLMQIAKKLLRHVKWNGIAMIEFKVSANGTPYLMEINARFWGSLQLAIDAGVNFPWLLYQMAVGNCVEEVSKYKIGIKNRWLLGDLDHLYIKLFNKEKGQAISVAEKLRTIIRFLNFFDINTRYEVNRWNDLTPFLYELRNYFKSEKE